ncbi:MAG: hypothetical protein WCO57_14205 [Verrucomicrobiota bacterium]
MLRISKRVRSLGIVSRKCCNRCGTVESNDLTGADYGRDFSPANPIADGLPGDVRELREALGAV